MIRRVLAVLSLLSLANLSVAQVAWSCTRVDGTAATSATADDHAHHGDPASDAALPDTPVDGSRHCVALAHCVIAPVIAVSGNGRVPPISRDRISASSELVPASAPLAPELPPPRA
jgi:hypothetical protein